ncbi:hypothetical protein F6455_15165 [Proteobacteria bacterium 005FR1]|nr:hypothetical protein [Proteobacteria bacterium 005FR1]
MPSSPGAQQGGYNSGAMPGGQTAQTQGSGQQTGGPQAGGQASPAGADGGQQQASAGSASENGGMPDTAQQSQNRSTEIDFSEESATGSRQAQNDAAGANGQSGDQSAGQAGQNGGAQQAGTAGGQPGGAGQPGGPGSPGAQSYEERVAVLERELDGSMSEYDGMILRERRNVLAQGTEEGSAEQVEEFDRSVAYYEEGDLSQAGGQQGDQNAPPAPGGQGGQGGTERTVAQAGGHPNGSTAGGPGRANDHAYAPPPDIPSGDDDDVVARQIREAAMYEDDPELREKLWEEYRKYKEQTR